MPLVKNILVQDALWRMHVLVGRDTADRRLMRRCLLLHP